MGVTCSFQSHIIVLAHCILKCSYYNSEDTKTQKSQWLALNHIGSNWRDSGTVLSTESMSFHFLKYTLSTKPDKLTT